MQQFWPEWGISQARLGGELTVRASAVAHSRELASKTQCHAATRLAGKGESVGQRAAGRCVRESACRTLTLAGAAQARLRSRLRVHLAGTLTAPGVQSVARRTMRAGGQRGERRAARSSSTRSFECLPYTLSGRRCARGAACLSSSRFSCTWQHCRCTRLGIQTAQEGRVLSAVSCPLAAAVSAPSGAWLRTLRRPTAARRGRSSPCCAYGEAC